jgi:PAS domain S-box-containing protein
MIPSAERAQLPGAEQRLRELEHHVQIAAQSAYLVLFVWDIQADKVRRLYSSEPSLPVGEGANSLESICQHVHPEDRAHFLARVNAAVSHPQGSYSSEYRLLRADGSIICLSERGRVELDAGGRPLRLLGISQDVTDRVASERRVAESESTLRSLYESSPFLMGVVELPADDSDIIHIYDNPATQAFFGQAATFEAERTGSELGAPHGAIRTWVEHYRRSETQRAPVKFQYQHATHPEPVWLSCVVACIGPSAGGRTRFSYVAEDITVQRRAERRMAEQARLLDLSNDAILVRDAEERIVYWNRGAERLYGFAAAEVLGKSAHLILRSRHPQPMQELTRLARLGRGWEGELEQQRRDGTPIVTLSRWVLDRTARDEVRILETNTDITERKRIRVQLQQSEEQFRQLAKNIPQLTWMADAPGEVFWYNQRWCDYTGLDSAQIRQLSWKAVMHPDQLEQVLLSVEQAIARREPWQDTFQLRGADGSYRWFLGRAFPIRDENGQVTRWFGTATDISELRATEAALREAKSELQQHAAHLEGMVAQRTERLRELVADLEYYSYTITHDLRTPLRTIQGFGQLLHDDYGSKLDEAGRSYLNRVIKASMRMDRLITDTLRYSQAAQAELELRPVDAGALLSGIIELDPRLQAPAADVQRVGALPWVLANESGLTQCFSNLLDNAVKFVKPGMTPRIRVSAELRGDRVRFWIEDNGVGIPADKHERVFRLFERLDSQFEGTGVGLALVRKVVQRMQGDIGFNSAVGCGTRFWLEFAAADRESAPQRGCANPNTGSGKPNTGSENPAC